VKAAPVPVHETARRIGDQLAKRCDAVLARHDPGTVVGRMRP
jgi:hypothetical protein